MLIFDLPAAFLKCATLSDRTMPAAHRHIVSIPVEPGDLAQIQSFATSHGIPMTRYVRRLMALGAAVIGDDLSIRTNLSRGSRRGHRLLENRDV